MNDALARHLLDDALVSFTKMKDQADRAIAQATDEELFVALDPESNSIAHLMQHLAGNMKSRWTDFLTTDGEKPDRDRDGEFVVGDGTTREALQARWEEGWRILFDAIRALEPADLDRSVFIRNEEHSVVQAINRQLTHHAGHVGQIIFLAKHFRSDAWETLSVPRGGTKAYNERMFSQKTSRR